LHHPPHFAEIQPVSQQAVAAALPCHGLVLNTHAPILHAPDVVIYRTWVRLLAGYMSGLRTDELGCLTVQKLDYVVIAMCWCICFAGI